MAYFTEDELDAAYRAMGVDPAVARGQAPPQAAPQPAPQPQPVAHAPQQALPAVTDLRDAPVEGMAPWDPSAPIPSLEGDVAQADQAFAERGYPSPGDDTIEGYGDLAGQGSTIYQQAGDAWTARRAGRWQDDPTGLHQQAQAKVAGVTQGMEDERQATEGAHAAELDTAQEQARQFAVIAKAKEDEMARSVTTEAVRQSESKQVEDRIREVDGEMTRARDLFMAEKDVDPDNWWSSRSAGQKVAHALSAALLGFAGMDPFAVSRKAVSDDIAAQKANIGKRGREYSMAGDRLNTVEKEAAQMRQRLGDERTADLVQTRARMEAIRAQFDGQLAEYGVRELSEKQKIFRSQLDQEIDTITFELQKEAKGYPARQWKAGGYVLQGRDATRAREQMGIGKGMMETGVKATVGTLSDRDKAAIKNMDAAQRGGLTPEAFEGSLKDLGAKVAAHEDMRRKTSKFLTKYPKDTDIPGVKKYTWQSDDPDALKFWDTSERDEAKAMMDQAFMGYKTAVTGAGASAEEIENIRKALFGAETEAAVRAAFQEMNDSADTHMKAYRKGRSDAVNRYFDRASVAGTETDADLGVGDPVL